jgi:hypothetical protein
MRTPSLVLTGPPSGLCRGLTPRFSLPLTEPRSHSECSQSSHLESGWKMRVGSQCRSHWSSRDAEPSSRRHQSGQWAQRGTVGGTGVCARCSPSRASNSARVMIDVRSPGRTDASFQVPSAVRLNEGHVGRRSLTSAPIRRGPQGCSIAVPWRERPRDLTGSAISPAATAEVAHATVSLPQPESAISILRPRRVG